MTYTLNNKEVLVVDVPRRAQQIEFHEIPKPHITYHVGSGTEDFDILRETLPAGYYDFLGRGSELTEEQAKGLVTQWELTGEWFDYTKMFHTLDSALQSFHSWLRSIGKEPETILVLINEK